MKCNDHPMPSVWVDNEEVVFKEGIPLEASKVYELLMGVLAQDGRVIVEFIVDGVDTLREGNTLESFTKIEARSQTHHELTLRLVMEASKHIINLDEEMQAYACNILKTSWSEVFQRMDELITKIKPFAKLFDHLIPYVQTYQPPWKEKFEEISSEQTKSLEGIMDSFEQGSTALLSDELVHLFCSTFRRGTLFFTEEIIPFLKIKITEGAVR